MDSERSALVEVLKSSNGENKVNSLSDLKNMIKTRSTRIRLLFSATIGLPNSGTTNLLLKLLERSSRVNKSNGLDVYQAVQFKDSFTGKCELKDITDTDDKNMAMLLFSVAKFLVTQHYFISIDALEKELSECEFSLNNNPELSAFFRKFSTKLVDMMKSIKGSPGLKTSIVRTQSFINFFDININSAVYEIVTILGGTYGSVILFNTIDLDHYTPEVLGKPLDLSDPFYKGKYREKDHHLFGLHKGFQYFVHNIEATFANQRERKNTIIVGTNANKIRGDEKCPQMQQLEDYATEIHIIDALPQEMLFIKGDDKGHEKVKKAFFKLMDCEKQFEVHVPVNFIFLLCFLQSTGKLFITQEELQVYASACFLERKEILAFIGIFQKCCSLFPVKVNEDFKYLILKPAEFVKGLEKLYRYDSPEEQKAQLECGIVSHEVLKFIWGVSHQEFFTTVLCHYGLMVSLDDNTFFVPSIRTSIDTDIPTCKSNSLIILYSISLLPFHKQCAFVTYFVKLNSQLYDVARKNCEYYNVIKFELKNKETEKLTEIAIRFRCDFIELSITSGISGDSGVYSFLKTSCVSLMNKMVREEFPNLRYNLAVVCPFSKEGDPLEFIKFDALDKSLENKSCNKCSFRYHPDHFESNPEVCKWVTEECVDLNHKNALQPYDVINPEKLSSMIKETRLSSLTIQDIVNLAKKLEIHEDLSKVNHDEVLFYVLYSWHCKNPSESKRKLARKLYELEFYKQAYDLDPELF